MTPAGSRPGATWAQVGPLYGPLDADYAAIGAAYRYRRPLTTTTNVIETIGGDRP